MVASLETVVLIVSAKLVIIDEGPCEGSNPVDAIFPDGFEHLGHGAPVVQGARDIVSLAIERLLCLAKDGEAKLAGQDGRLESVPYPIEGVAVQPGCIVAVGIRLIADVPVVLRNIDRESAQREQGVALVARASRNTVGGRDDQVWGVQILEVYICVGAKLHSQHSLRKASSYPTATDLRYH